MLVSTREATSIKVLTSPAALDLMRFPRRFFCARRLPLPWLSFAFPLASQYLVKQFQPFFHVHCCGTPAPGGSGNSSDRVPSRHPLQLNAGADPVLVGYGLGHCNLQLAGNLAHILTLARIESLHPYSSLVSGFSCPRRGEFTSPRRRKAASTSN